MRNEQNSHDSQPTIPVIIRSFQTIAKISLLDIMNIIKMNMNIIPGFSCTRSPFTCLRRLPLNVTLVGIAKITKIVYNYQQQNQPRRFNESRFASARLHFRYFFHVQLPCFSIIVFSSVSLQAHLSTSHLLLPFSNPYRSSIKSASFIFMTHHPDTPHLQIPIRIPPSFHQDTYIYKYSSGYLHLSIRISISTHQDTSIFPLVFRICISC